MDSVLALEAQLVIRNLYRYRDQDRVAGNAQKIETVLEFDLLANNA